MKYCGAAGSLGSLKILFLFYKIIVMFIFTKLFCILRKKSCMENDFKILGTQERRGGGPQKGDFEAHLLMIVKKK